jgi:hypothetical protein
MTTRTRLLSTLATLGLLGSCGTEPDLQLEPDLIIPDELSNRYGFVMTIGDRAQLDIVLRDASTGQEMSGYTIVWTSSSPGVATVDQTGLVVAVGAGATTIDASVPNQVQISNELGQSGTAAGHLVPTMVSGNVALGSLTVGGQHTCGIGLDAVAYCWGDNDEGQLGIRSTGTPVNTPVIVAGQTDGP